MVLVQINSVLVRTFSNLRGLNLKSIPFDGADLKGSSVTSDSQHAVEGDRRGAIGPAEGEAMEQPSEEQKELHSSKLFSQTGSTA